MSRLLVMAGGTGGHIYPALAVATLWREQGGEVVWMGAPNSMESRLVPQHGVELQTISIGGLRGKRRVTQLLAPVRLLRALWQAVAVVRRVDPDVVLGMGGFASGPGGVAAWLLRRPLVVHEQNAIAGLTNRLLSRFATVVLEAFAGTFAQREKVSTVGNPLRSGLQQVAEVSPHQPLRLLVLGGSLGARRINQLVAEVAASLQGRVALYHQTGANHLQDTESDYVRHGVNIDGQQIRVVPYIESMEEAYSWCDLVLCRAGAMTVSELALVGRGAILVPFPFAVDDHQSANGAVLQRAGAAQLIQQHELDAKRLLQLLEQWMEDPQPLLEMGRSARSLGKAEAAQEVVAICQANALRREGS